MRQLLDFADFGGVSSSHISASLRYCATGMMALMAITRCHQLSGLQQWIRRQHINDPHHVLLYQDYLKIVICSVAFLKSQKTTKKKGEPEILDLVEVPSSNKVPMKRQVSRGTAPAAPAPAPASTLAPVQKEVMEAFPASD